MAYIMLSDITLARDPQSSAHAASKNYVDTRDALYQTYSASAPSTPILGAFWTDTTAAPTTFVLKQYNGSTWDTIATSTGGLSQATADTRYVNIDGDTMTAELILSGNPSNVLGATPKQYVDLRALGATVFTAGNGLTGGGDLSTARTFTVGAGTGITVNADDVAVNRTTVDTWYSAAGHNHDTLYVELGGDTLTGYLTLHANPSSDFHAATKQYVDISSQGFSFKQAVRVVSTINVAALTGLLTVDGVTLVANDRVLLAAQSTPSQNGIYVAASGAWTRATDMDASGELKDGTLVPVAAGTLGADSQYMCTAIGADPWVPASSSSTWTRYSSVADLVAGAGLTKTGTTLDVGAGSGITVATDSVAVDSATVQFKSQRSAASGYASLDSGTKVPIAELPTGTSSSTVSLGDHTHSTYALGATTMTAGAGLTGGGDLSTARTFDVVALSTGGLQVNTNDVQIKLDGSTLQTNSSGLSVLSAPQWTTTRNLTLTGVVTGTTTVNGAGDITLNTSGAGLGSGLTRYSQTLTGGSTTEVVTHSLNTLDVYVQVYNLSTGAEVGVDNARTSVNAVTLTFASAPAASTYRAVIVG